LASTPMATSMWPVPSTSWVDAWPSRTLPPRPPATALCWIGPGIWVRWRRSGWRAAAAMALVWRAFSVPRASWSWRSIGPIARLAGGGASRTRWMPRLLLERCWPGRSPPSQDRQPPGGDGAVSAGGQSHRGQGPQPGHQRPPGPGGHRCARAPRAAAGAARDQAGWHGRAARAWPDPDHPAATKLALRLLGERCAALDAELARLDAELDHLTAQAAPRLRQLCGVGSEIAGALPRYCAAPPRSRPPRARRCGIG
jgi:hypothetical protein